MRKKELLRRLSLLILLLCVPFLFSSCDLLIKIPTWLRLGSNPSAENARIIKALESKLKQMPGTQVHLEGDDIIFSLSDRVGNVSSYVTNVFNTLASLADSHYLEISIAKESISTPYEAGVRAQALVAGLGPSNEEIEYSAALRYQNEEFLLRGELVFRNLYLYYLMNDGEYLVWKDEQNSFNTTIHGMRVVYHSMSGNSPSINLNSLVQLPDCTDVTYSMSGDTITALNLSNGASTFIVHVEGIDPESNQVAEDVIVKIGSVQIKNDESQLYTIEDALARAQNKELFVLYNTSFASADVADEVYGGTEQRIESSTTLILPYSSSLSTQVDDNPGNNKYGGAITRDQEYVRLTVPEGITINVKGTLIVNAQRAAHNTRYQGHVTGNMYSILHLEEGSSVNIEHRGELCALGFVEGLGTIEAQSGSKIYEGLFISSFRGGSASVNIYNQVFPFDQFTVAQIETSLIVHAGANYIAKALAHADYSYHSGNFPLFGEEALIRLTDGTLTKTFDSSTAQVTFTIHGNGSINNSTVTMGRDVFSTKNRAIPFDGRWKVVVASGSTITADASLAFLPGSHLIIEENARLTVKAPNTLTIFTWEYKDGYNTYPNPETGNYYRHSTELEYGPSELAVVDNSGTLTINSGAGIAGKVLNPQDLVLHEGFINSYIFYRVEGEAKAAKTVPYAVYYPSD